MIDITKVNRLEVINESGRVYTRYNCKPLLNLQDDGKTLKIFVEGVEKQESDYIPGRLDKIRQDIMSYGFDHFPEIGKDLDVLFDLSYKIEKRIAMRDKNDS